MEFFWLWLKPPSQNAAAGCIMCSFDSRHRVCWWILKREWNKVARQTASHLRYYTLDARQRCRSCLPDWHWHWRCLAITLERQYEDRTHASTGAETIRNKQKTNTYSMQLSRVTFSYRRRPLGPWQLPSWAACTLTRLQRQQVHHGTGAAWHNQHDLRTLQRVMASCMTEGENTLKIVFARQTLIKYWYSCSCISILIWISFKYQIFKLLWTLQILPTPSKFAELHQT